MKYKRWKLVSAEIGSHTPWWTWALSTWKSKYATTIDQPLYMYELNSYSPYMGGITVGGTYYPEAFFAGFEFRQLLENAPVSDVVIPFEWKESQNNGKDWRARHETGKIVFGDLDVGNGKIVGKPFTVEPEVPTATFTTQKIMGYDGNFYYDSAEAEMRTGAWCFLVLTYRFDIVEQEPSSISPDVNWVGHPTSWFSRKINTGLVTSVLASANSGEMDVLTELAELPETVKWLIDILRGVPKIIKTFKDRKAVLEKKLKKAKKTAVEIADAVASLWLQYRYALMPIFYSIEDIKSALKAYKRIYAKYRSKEVEEIELPFASLGYTFNGNARTTHRCVIKRAYAPEDLVDRLLDILKMNPLATAWELVTLSFVVDWFVNIGDVIDALTGYDSSVDSAACYSWRTEISGSLIHEETKQEIQISCDSYLRNVIDPFSHVGLSLNFDLTWKQKVDALALLWGPVSKSLKESLK